MITVDLRSAPPVRAASPMDYGYQPVPRPETHRCLVHVQNGFGDTPERVLDRYGTEICSLCAADQLGAAREALDPTCPTHPAAERVHATLRAAASAGRARAASDFMAGLRSALDSDELKTEIRRLLAT